MSEAGLLYGTTTFGGAQNWGTVYELTPPAAGNALWTERILHEFTNGNDGGSPWCPVTIQADRSLLGSTLGGGSGGGGIGGFGEYWRLAPRDGAPANWDFTTVHDFVSSPHDGSGPIGGLLPAPGGGYYSVTSTGGAGRFGAIVRLDRPQPGASDWKTTVMHSFTGGNDGRQPLNALIADPEGRLYGTAQEHGAFNSGTAFMLTPPTDGEGEWTETTIWAFTKGVDGGQPRSGLTRLKDGSLVGTTFAGGAFTVGVAYRLLPPAPGQSAWTQQLIHTFTGRADGASPNGGLSLVGRGGLLGTASAGGADKEGVVFRLKPSTKGNWSFKVVHAFVGKDGAHPVGDLLVQGSHVFGVTEGDTATAAPGTVYEIGNAAF